VLKDGDRLVFGRNYDWDVGVGLVIINKRNLRKVAAVNPPDKPIQWTSRYGSITFNQYGKEYPMGGLNEAGLVVELMMLGQSEYPAPDERPAITELAWIQYQLDNFKSVQEVIDSDQKVRITNDSVPIHFLVCDRSGQVAAIEFLEGRMVCHTGATLPFEALTNSTYDDSIRYLKKHKGYGGDRNPTRTTQSLDRFVTAVQRIKAYRDINDRPLIDYAFEILDNVSQKTHTQWSIVYDIQNLKVHFKTRVSSRLKTVSLKEFDLSCQVPSPVTDIDTNRTGDITGFFIPYSTEINKDLIYKSYRQTSFLKNTPDQIIEEHAKYPESIVCQGVKKKEK
jgi:choloylglycine hydrolase